MCIMIFFPPQRFKMNSEKVINDTLSNLNRIGQTASPELLELKKHSLKISLSLSQLNQIQDSEEPYEILNLYKQFDTLLNHKVANRAFNTVRYRTLLLEKIGELETQLQQDHFLKCSNIMIFGLNFIGSSVFSFAAVYIAATLTVTTLPISSALIASAVLIGAICLLALSLHTLYAQGRYFYGKQFEEIRAGIDFLCPPPPLEAANLEHAGNLDDSNAQHTMS